MTADTKASAIAITMVYQLAWGGSGINDAARLR
jgi:hypothetical protein